MLRLKALGKDHYGALLIVALGISVLVASVSYRIGSLTQMGSGFFPMVLGVLLLLTGIAIGLTATPANSGEASAASDKTKPHGGFEWRSWSCILGGLAAFIVFAVYGGMLLASFSSVFIAAMGDRQNTVRHAVVIGVIMTAIYVVVFHYGLRLPPPLFRWG